MGFLLRYQRGFNVKQKAVREDNIVSGIYLELP